MRKRFASMLAISDRLYRWMVGFYPKEFRSEFESEMVQSFRDDCRGELREGSLFKLFLFWGRTLLDLVTSALVEHLKRRRSMNAMEKDLRWDVSYGLQMFLKHSMLALKYSLLCAAGVFVLLVSALYVGGSVWVWVQQEPVNAAWRNTIGQTPDEFYQSMLRRFPKTEKSSVASQLETTAERLGIFGPVVGKNYKSEALKANGILRTLDAPPYLYAQLNKASDAIDEPPEEIRTFLQVHAADLNSLYSLVEQGEAPRWEIDLSQLLEAPCPNLTNSRQLHGVIALDILEKTRLGDDKAALRALEASWKISESLRERPELISQLVGLSVFSVQAGVVRKMKQVPLEWEKRMSLDILGPRLRALEVDAVVDAEYFSGPRVSWKLSEWSDSTIMSGRLGRPLRRALALQSLGVTERIVARWKQGDACSFDPDSFQREIEQSLSDWNPSARNYPRIWKDIAHAAANLELTQRILQLKRRQSSSQNNGGLEPVGMPSLICRGAEWGQKVNTDGTVLVSCNRLPDWLKERSDFSRLSLTYVLRIKE